MQVELTDEQRMLRDSALDWLASNYDFRQREASVHRDGGSAKVWNAFADMGWLGLRLPERVGGLAWGLLESCLLSHVLGQFLVTEPYQTCALQAGRLLALAGTPAQQDCWLPGLVTGQHRLALAHGEASSSLLLCQPATVARPTDSGWIIEGAKAGVRSAPGAVRWIVSARIYGREGPFLFLVDPSADGVSVDAYDTTDGGRAADIRFDRVAVGRDAHLPAGGVPNGQRDLLRVVLAEGVINDCWYAVGAMRAAFWQTARYVQQRHQFGQALSKLQVVQHRIAEMAVACADALATCEVAALRVERDAASGVDVACMARSKIARATRYVSQQCVQLHGAMGVCEELSIAATFRTLSAFFHWEGRPDEYAAAYGQSLLSSDAFAPSLMTNSSARAGQEYPWT